MKATGPKLEILRPKLVPLIEAQNPEFKALGGKLEAQEAKLQSPRA